MKTYIKYGAGIAIGNTLVSLVFFALGYHATGEKIASVQWITVVLSLVITVTGAVLGIRARRAEVPADKPFGYPQALGAGVMIALFCGLIGSVTNFLYTRVLNPRFNDLMLESQSNKMAEAGVSAAQIEQMEKGMKMMTNPFIQAGSAIVGAVFMGFLLSLILAIFLRRKGPDAPPVG